MTAISNPILALTGVKFPATTVNAADVNTLDDYEEGTWTPGVEFGGASVGVTYSSRAGSYTKIGNRVLVNCYVELSNKGSSTGAMTLTGLPFPVQGGGNFSPASVRCLAITFTGMIEAFADVSSVFFSQLTEAGAASSLTDANFSNTSSMMVSAQYRI